MWFSWTLRQGTCQILNAGGTHSALPVHIAVPVSVIALQFSKCNVKEHLHLT